MPSETKKLTLWDRLRGKKPPSPEPEKAVEEKFYNPLDLRIGSFVTIDDPAFSDMEFIVYEIVEYRRNINDKVFFFNDYRLRTNPIDGEPVKAFLRLTPMAEPEGDISHYVVVGLIDESEDSSFGWSQDFENVVTDESGEFIVSDNGVDDIYYRYNDVEGSYQADLSIVRDENNDGKVEDNEVERQQIQYWDFWRKFINEGVEEIEFLYVEENLDHHWYTIHIGREIDPVRVSAV